VQFYIFVHVFVCKCICMYKHACGYIFSSRCIKRKRRRLVAAAGKFIVCVVCFVHLFECVCVCVYIYICVCVCVCVYIYIYIYVCVCVKRRRLVAAAGKSRVYFMFVCVCVYKNV
jgi:hypothetical protein